MVCPQSQRQLEGWPDRPFILGIQAQRIHCLWLSWPRVESLRKQICSTAKKAPLGLTNRFAGREESWIIVGDVIPPVINPKLKIVRPVHLREIVHDLVLCHIAALGPVIQIAPQIIEASPGESHAIRHESRRGRQIRWFENGAIPGTGEDELVRCGPAKYVRPIELTFVLRLITLGVEDAVKGIGVGGLQAMIRAEMDIRAIIRSNILVDACTQHPFVSEIASRRPELQSTWCATRQRKRSVATVAAGYWRGTAGPRSVVVNREHLLVKGKLSRLSGPDISQGCALKCCAWDFHLSAGRQHQSKSLVINKEEGLITYDRSSDRG